jgi:hypothetical protein
MNLLSSEKFRWALVVMALVLGVALFYVATQEAPIGTVPQPIQRIFKDQHKLRYIRVIQGHEFDLKLEDGTRAHAVLKVRTPPEAKDRVVAYINASRNPEVLIYDKKEDGTWEVDLLFNGISLTHWLRQQGLAWE